MKQQTNNKQQGQKKRIWSGILGLGVTALVLSQGDAADGTAMAGFFSSLFYVLSTPNAPKKTAKQRRERRNKIYDYASKSSSSTRKSSSSSGSSYSSGIFFGSGSSYDSSSSYDSGNSYGGSSSYSSNSSSSSSGGGCSSSSSSYGGGGDACDGE
ncbi:MAG: hypothetical protein AAF518_15875 [Spirochaetota bacterium]